MAWVLPSLPPGIADVRITRTADHEQYLDAMAVAGAIPNRKLFGGTNGDAAMTDEEMTVVGARIRAYHGQGGTMGALAMVVSSERTHRLARSFGALAAADRSIKIFRDAGPARRWLEAQS